MPSNLHLDDQLIARAMKLGGHRTKHAAVMQALADYVQSLEQQKITQLFGSIRYQAHYNYKKQRAKK